MRILLHTFLTLIISITVHSQEITQINIINADRIIANANIHPEYWRLIDNIVFEHNNTIMHCDSAHHFKNENKIYAFGNIKIIKKDSLKVSGERLIYYAGKNLAEISGNVKMSDQHIKIETNQIDYNIKDGYISYNSKGKIIEKEKIVLSEKGTYYTSSYIFHFKDSVEVIGLDYNIKTNNMKYNSETQITYFFGPSYISSLENVIYCEDGWYDTKNHTSKFQRNAYISNEEYLLKGDSLFYDKELGYGKAIHNVEIIDTIENINVSGDFAEYFSKKNTIIITNNAVLKMVFDNDTLFMRATRFVNQQQKFKKKILAFNNVSFFKSNLQGRCDSLAYNIIDSTMKMYEDPILWSNKLQVTGDTLEFLIYERQLKKLFVKNQPMIIEKEDSVDYNQIKGKEMTIYFKNKEIKKVYVKGNAQSIFLLQDSDQKKLALNYTESTDITLHFNKNNLDGISYRVKPISNSIPYHNLKEEDRYLKGFLWREYERPLTKNQILIE